MGGAVILLLFNGGPQCPRQITLQIPAIGGELADPLSCALPCGLVREAYPQYINGAHLPAITVCMLIGENLWVPDTTLILGESKPFYCDVSPELINGAYLPAITVCLLITLGLME